MDPLPYLRFVERTVQAQDGSTTTVRILQQLERDDDGRNVWTDVPTEQE